MIARRTTWLAVSLWTVSVLLAGFASVLGYANGGPAGDSAVIESIIVFSSIVSLSVVGTLLAAHRPENPLGWIFLSAAISLNVLAIAGNYAQYITETAPGRLPEIFPLFWVAAWSWIPGFILPATFGILLFPTGRLPSRQWRPFAWVAVVSLALMIVVEMFDPGALLDPPGAYPRIINPIGIESLSGLIDAILIIEDVTLFCLIAGAVVSIFARLRTATGFERQQIKWFAYAAIVPVVGISVYLTLLVSPVGNDDTANWVGGTTIGLGIAILPITIGIAILRDNLYDIDRLINRTLVYGSLTFLLGLCFASSVVLLQLILSPFTSGNDLAVAGSTLLVFALFRPLRGRLQSAIDRRFYRSRYDAQRTLQDFSVRTRDAVDLDQLTTELTGIVSTTMQPAHVSVWLRTAPAGEDRI